uniref:F-box domain-containing protein n=1 Tax=Oryza meridionalis TaxID=40149 RepID=A0A0E0BZ34_9ORYZ
MGKAISLLRPPREPQPRESEGEKGRMMELRKRPRPRRVDPDFVSSPPASLLLPPPRKRARRQAAPPAAPAPAPAPAPARPSPAARRRPTCARVIIQSPVAGLQPSVCCPCEAPLRACRLPRASFLARRRPPFDWYEADMWTEVAKYLFGAELVRLSSTCRWFRRLLADEFIWRHAFLRDLSLLPSAADRYPPRPLHRSWRLLYAAAFNGAHSYWFRRSSRHIGAYRIGGFLLESPYMLLTAKLAVPQWLPPQEDGPQIAIEMTGACVLPNARPGIWITDFHLVRCPNCTLNKCAGVLQVLDARHCELFLEQGFWNGTWEYEDLGDHYNDEVTPTAACAIFNASTRAHESISCVLHSKSWVRRCDDPQPKAHCRPYAVALNSNLLSNSNQGLVSRFQAMRDTTRNGQIVSIRITQQIY